MTHPCPKCGASVDDAKRFCGECGAPQNGIDDQTPATPPMPPGTPGELQPAAEPVSPMAHLPGKAALSDRSLFLRSSLIASVLGTAAILLAGLFAATGAAAVQPFVFLLMIACGGVAVTFYTRKAHTGITAGRGFKLGLMTGFFGAIMLLGLSMLGLLSSQGRAEFRKTLTDTLNAAAAANPDPAAKDIADKMVAGISTPGGLAAFLLLMMGFATVVYLILAGIGGAIGAALFGRHPVDPRQVPS